MYASSVRIASSTFSFSFGGGVAFLLGGDSSGYNFLTTTSGSLCSRPLKSPQNPLRRPRTVSQSQKHFWKMTDPTTWNHTWFELCDRPRFSQYFDVVETRKCFLCVKIFVT